MLFTDMFVWWWMRSAVMQHASSQEAAAGTQSDFPETETRGEQNIFHRLRLFVHPPPKHRPQQHQHHG